MPREGGRGPRSRAEIERRQKDLTGKEDALTSLSEKSSSYEKGLKEMSERIKSEEEKLLGDEVRLRKMIEEMSTVREGLLAKKEEGHCRSGDPFDGGSADSSRGPEAFRRVEEKAQPKERRP